MNKINYIYTTNKLGLKLKEKFKLKDTYNKNLNCLFIGIKNDKDIIKIKNHLGQKSILWTGREKLLNTYNNYHFIYSIKTIGEIDKITHYAINNIVKMRLKKLKNIKIFDKSIFVKRKFSIKSNYKIDKNKLSKYYAN